MTIAIKNIAPAKSGTVAVKEIPVSTCHIVLLSHPVHTAMHITGQVVSRGRTVVTLEKESGSWSL